MKKTQRRTKAILQAENRKTKRKGGEIDRGRETEIEGAEKEK